MPEQNPRPNRHRRRRRRRINYTAIIFWLVVLLVIVGIVAIVMTIAGGNKNSDPAGAGTLSGEATSSTKDTTTEPTTDGTPPSTEQDPPDVPQKPVAKPLATIGVTGDVLMHLPCIEPAQTANGYDFSPYFTHIQDYLSAPDYMVANLETTLAGTAYKYSGWPSFNCPDEIVYDLQAAGVDMFLTANNHSYDTKNVGFDRTLQIMAEAGLDFLGTKQTESADDYLVKEIDGIKIGMVCYTYETDINKNTVQLNPGPSLPASVANRINTFYPGDLESFIKNLRQNIADMKTDGAEAIVLYIHWGEEYQRQPNASQVRFAQAACDLGVDVIVGGHPHEMQPMDLLTSTTNEAHKTVCLYSTGNFMSNQRLGNISYVPTAHTEDGILFSFSFARWADGTVRLKEVELLPLWIDLRTSTTTGKLVYDVLPLDKEVEDWKSQFGLTDDTLKQAQDSYERTMEIVGAGLKEVQNYLNTLPPVE